MKKGMVLAGICMAMVTSHVHAAATPVFNNASSFQLAKAVKLGRGTVSGATSLGVIGGEKGGTVDPTAGCKSKIVTTGGTCCASYQHLSADKSTCE